MLTRSGNSALLNVQQPLDKIYRLEFKDPDLNLSKVFNVESMTSAEYLDMNSHGIGELENVGEGGAVPYDDPGLGKETRYAYQIYKKGVQVTEEMAEDEKYAEMKNKMKWLASRASYDPVLYGFGVFRNAFTANPTGYANFNSGSLALCSNSQVYEDGSVSGTQDNYLTAALSMDSYEDAKVALQQQKAGNGQLIAFSGTPTLLVPPALERVAVEITKSEKDPETANNAVNVYRGSSTVVVSPFIGSAVSGGSDTAWFLLSPEHKINFFWRTRPTFGSEVDFDTNVLKYKVIAKYIAGFSDWRGVVGSAGTA